MRNSHRKWYLFLSENHEISKNRGFQDEIDILWYQIGAEKINKTIKNIISLFWYYILIKNYQKCQQKYQKMPNILWNPMKSFEILLALRKCWGAVGRVSRCRGWAEYYKVNPLLDSGRARICNSLCSWKRRTGSNRAQNGV